MMSCSKKTLACLLGAVLSGCAFAGTGASRTMCLGDSITHFGYTEYYLQLFENLRHPGSGLRYYNAGYSGGTVGTGKANYDFECRRIRPDRVCIMFGMNDVLWTTFETNATLSAERKAAVDGAMDRYAKDYRSIVDQVRASGVTNIALVTPSPYDEYSVKLASQRKRNVNEYGLAKAARIVREVAKEKGVPVVDIHAAMTELCRKYPDHGLCGGDRVHPPKLGHLFMAFQHLAGATNPVADVCLKADGTVVRSDNAAVRNVQAAAGSLAFDYAPRALPFPMLEDYRALVRLWPQAAHFNREMLSVAGLPANTRWTLKADGRILGEFTADALTAGVNLAERDTPNARLALQAAQAMQALHDFDRPRRDRACVRRTFESFKVPMTDKAALMAASDKRLAGLKAMKYPWYDWERDAAASFLSVVGKEQEVLAEEDRLYKAMEAVRPAACRLELVRVQSEAAFNTRDADLVADGHVCEIGIPWHFPSNRIDWLFNPTKAKPPYNPEWTWQLNRLGGWRVLADAYAATKDEKYARAFAVQLADWLDQTGAVPPEKNYNAHGSPWRTIEEGLRLMGPMPVAYHAFKNSPSVPAALTARYLECMLAQARHLMAHPSPKGNWLLMEMNGVYTFACSFPELPESASLRKDSAAILAAAIREQVLPDGLHYELSPDYHLVFYICASQMYATAKEHGFAHELPADFAAVLERGADGFVKMVAPGFVQPRFNDCYTIETKRVLKTAAKLFPHRKDFLWAATEGREGEPPAGATPSRFLPYSGFAVMRSGWDRDAAYLAFDVGPLGMGHWHQDKLSFTLWKGDEELVFDDGGGQYEESAFRKYALSGYDHNTLLVDGLAQFRRDPKVVEGPIDAGWTSTPARDVARGVYDQGFGPKQLKLARHTREIAFEKPQDLFRVTDTATSADGDAHVYELLFHVDTTNVVVAADGRSLVARFGKKWDLALTVEQGGAISLQSGAEKPRLAGWFVGRNNLDVHKATTITVTAPRAKDATFVTTFRPIASAPFP